jgi:hypothetical protein
MNTSQKSSLNKNQCNPTQWKTKQKKMIPFMTKTFVTLTWLNAILLILSISSLLVVVVANCVWTEGVCFWAHAEFLFVIE